MIVTDSVSPVHAKEKYEKTQQYWIQTTKRQTDFPVLLSETRMIYFARRRSIRGFPAWTTSFGFTNIFSTLAPAILCSALTGISSFMASKIETICSSLMTSPSLTSTFQTLAFNGASTAMISGSVRDRIRQFVSFKTTHANIESRNLPCIKSCTVSMLILPASFSSFHLTSNSFSILSISA